MQGCQPLSVFLYTHTTRSNDPIRQVFPVVSRLCAPIEGTDAGRLADCLGLDGSRYRHVAAGQGESREDALLAAAASLDDDDRCDGGPSPDSSGVLGKGSGLCMAAFQGGKAEGVAQHCEWPADLLASLFDMLIALKLPMWSCCAQP